MSLISVYFKQKTGKKNELKNLRVSLKMTLCKQGLRNEPIFTT